VSEGVTYVTYTDLKGSVIVALLLWFTPIYICVMYVRPELNVMNILKLLLVFTGVFSAMLSQHMLHRYLRVSSVKSEATMFSVLTPLSVAICVAIYLSFITTVYVLLWSFIGFVLLTSYSITRKFWYSNEILAGLAWSSIFFGSYTVLTNELLPPYPITMMFLGLAGYYGLIVFCYRVITGDYKCPVNRKVVSKLLIWLFISTLVLALSI